MEHKTWRWKIRSMEKTMVAADKVNKGNEEEVQTLLADKAELEREMKILNERLSSAFAESHAKDDIAKKQTKFAQEAFAGWEKAETEAITLKQELEKATQQRVSGEERLVSLDAALRECMQQLRFVREEQEKKIQDAVTKTSREFEKARISFEEKLAETSKRLARFGSDNTQLAKALLVKEKMIDDLNEIMARADANFSAVQSRLESTEKEKASLSYEVQVLEKELEIRNEEREFNHQAAEVAHRQHLENVKKIAKLESESQRLRLLVRKKLPGPAALAKMKNEVEMLGRDPAETRRRKSNPFPTASTDFANDNTCDTPSKRIDFLSKQLRAIEEEKRTLKELLNKKTSELQLSSVMYANTASKLSKVEAQLEESSKVQAAVGPAKHLLTPRKLCLASSSDMGSDEKVSVTESWTPSCKTVGGSDIGLMDDFVEMENLAIVCVDKPFGSSNHNLSESVDNRETSDYCDASDPPRVSGFVSGETPNRYLNMGSSNGLLGHNISSTMKSNQQGHSDLNKSIHRLIELIEGISLPSRDYGALEIVSRKDDGFSPYTTLETPTGYMVRVFQWKASELGAVLQQFLQSCTSLLNGKADVENFAKELTSALEWVMNHSFSLQDVSSLRDEIKKHFDWDECRNENEVEGGIINHSSEADKVQFPKEQSSGFPIVSAWNVRNSFSHLDELQREESRRSKDELENMESSKKNLEGRLQSENAKSESSIIQLRESEKSIGNLKTEVGALKQWKGLMQDQIENHNMVKEDLDKLISMVNVELSEARRKSTCLENELENKSSYEELETTYLDHQLRPESVTKKDIQKYDSDQDDMQLRTDSEITAVSEKLAECQETIRNLGKQLKALASPRDSSLFDKVMSNTPTDTLMTTSNTVNSASNPTGSITTAPNPCNYINQRSSLLDKMMAEDSVETGDLMSTKEVICTSTSPMVLGGNSSSIFSPQRFRSLNGIKHEEEEEALVNFLSIVPRKKKGSGGLLKKLLWMRKKGNGKKTPFPLATK